MKSKGQAIIEWAYAAIVLLILAFVFYSIGNGFCQADKTFCGIFSILLPAFLVGAVLFLRRGR